MLNIWSKDLKSTRTYYSGNRIYFNNIVTIVKKNIIIKGEQGLSRQTLNSNISKTTKGRYKILKNYERSDKTILKKIY